MPAKCPACNKTLSPFKLRKDAFVCPSCGAMLRAVTPTFYYLGFRLLAGAIAASIATPFESCFVCSLLIIICVVALLAFLLVSVSTKVVLLTPEGK